MTGDGAKTYTWNARNQLTNLSGSVTAGFSYDGVGQRRAKTIGGVSTAFLYDGLNVVQELVSGSPSANIMLGLAVDESFTRTDSGGPRHLLSDALGGTVALTDDSATVRTEYSYEPFGKTAISGATNGNQVQFTGRENDATGLYSFRARFYSPEVQRFISEDPIQFAGGDVNLHAYVRNNPTNIVDPSGLFVSNIPFCDAPPVPGRKTLQLPWSAWFPTCMPQVLPVVPSPMLIPLLFPPVLPRTPGGPPGPGGDPPFRRERLNRRQNFSRRRILHSCHQPRSHRVGVLERCRPLNSIRMDTGSSRSRCRTVVGSQ
jgi:RHS repeat-associated protein